MQLKISHERSFARLLATILASVLMVTVVAAMADTTEGGTAPGANVQSIEDVIRNPSSAPERAKFMVAFLMMQDPEAGFKLDAEVRDKLGDSIGAKIDRDYLRGRELAIEGKSTEALQIAEEMISHAQSAIVGYRLRAETSFIAGDLVTAEQADDVCIDMSAKQAASSALAILSSVPKKEDVTLQGQVLTYGFFYRAQLPNFDSFKLPSSALDDKKKAFLAKHQERIDQGMFPKAKD